MQFKDYLPVIGWFITFALGVLSGGIIIPRLTKKRKVIAWAVMSESDLIPRELAQVLNMPVVLQVGNYQPNSLSLVKLRFGNAGNDVIENFRIAVSFSERASILEVRPIKILREYRNKINWTFQNNTCHLEVEFINPGKSFELEYILNDHEAGAIDVDLAGPGLELRRQAASLWDKEFSPTIGKLQRGFGVNLLGFQIDYTAIAMTEIAEELREIRKKLP